MSPKVLFVDDESQLLEQAQIFLERENEKLEVETTTSGQEALEKIRERDFDAIIADYLLPDVDGVEILQRLREEENNIPFFIVTGLKSNEAEKTCLESGADGFFVKSANPKSLYQRLADAVIEETA